MSDKDDTRKLTDQDWLTAALNSPERDVQLFATGADVLLQPIAGWSTATLPEDNVMLAVQFLTAPPETRVRTIRFAMKRAQCAELSKVLDRLSRLPHVTPSGNPN